MNMKFNARALLGSVAVLLLPSSVIAQTLTYTDTASPKDSSWSNAANWNGGVGPSPGSNTPDAILVATVPNIGGVINVNTGAPTNAIGSLTFGSTLGATVTIQPNSVEALQVNGGITNSSTFAGGQVIALPVFAGANATYAGGVGLSIGDLSLVSSTGTVATITTTGAITITNSLTFTLNSSSSFSQVIANSGNLNASTNNPTIFFGGNYTGNAGDLFQVATGNNFSFDTNVNTANLTSLSPNITAVTTLIKKGIIFFQPTPNGALLGGNLINAGVTLPIGNDTELNPIGTAATNVTMNGGELLTNNNNAALDTGAVPDGTPFSTTDTIALNAVAGNTFAATNGTTATYGGLISGPGALTIGSTGNTGTVVFTVGNSYSGGTTIFTGSTLQLGTGAGGSAAGSPGTGNIVDNGTLIIDRSNAATDNGTSVISGAGNIIQEGNGTFTLAATDTSFTGSTSINAGTLDVTGTLGAPLPTTSTLAVGTAGTLSGSGTVNANASITGNGVINFTNPGVITGTLAATGGNWNGAGSVTGAVTSSSGNFNIGTGANLTANGGVNVTGGSISSTDGTGTITGSVNYTSGTGSTFNGVIAGAGKTLTLNHAGTTLTLGGTNTYTGATTITAGTLNVTGSTAAGSTVGVGTAGTLAGSGTVNGNATLTGNGIINLTNPGTIGGTLAVTGGNWNGAGSVTGAVTSSSGAFNIGSGANLTANGGLNVTGGSISGTDATSAITGSVNYTSNTASTFNGVIAGAGKTLTMNSAGTTLTLGGTNTYTGATTITAGTLNVTGSTAAGSTVGIATAGTLAGSGTVNGNATLTGNGIINLTNPGTIGGTLAVTGGNWNGAGSVTGAVTSSSGAFNIGNGANLTANGGLNVTGGSIAAGNASSTITGSVNYTSNTASTFNGVIAGAGKTLTMNSAGTTFTLGGTNTYTGATTITAGTLTVNGSTAAGSTVGVGTAGTLAGSGTVNGSATLTGNGIINLTNPGTIGGTLAVTGGNWNGAGSVTGAVTSGSGALTIGSGANLTANGGLNVTGGTIASGSATSTITGSVNYTSGSSSTFGGVIAGAGKTLTMNNGASTLTLTGANTYTGATTITAGTVTLSGTGSLGSSPISIGNGATLAATGTTNTVGGGITDSGGIINLQNNAINTLSGSTLAGNGTLSIDVGSGGTSDKLALTGAASLAASAYTINVASLAGASTGTAYTFISAGSGLSASDFTLGTVTGGLAGDTGAFNVVGNTVTLTFTAANGYYYTGAADTVFSNLNNYVNQASGGTVPVAAISGTTNIFIGSTSPTPTNITPAVTSNIAINSLTFTPTGSGALISGGSTLTINNGVTVQSGVAGTETISAPVALGGNQTWTVTDAGSTLNDSGGISGAFGLTKAGAGTLILTSADTFSGPTVVNGGALRLANANSVGSSSSVTVNTGGALQLAGGLTFAAVPTTLNGTGIAGAGALESFSGVNTYGGAVTLGSNATIGADVGSTLNLTGPAITGSGFTLTLTGAGDINVASDITTGTGGLTVSTTGVDTLTGANTFTGVTNIMGGTLAIGAGGTLADSSGINLSGATAVFNISLAGGNQTIQDINGVTGSIVNLGANGLTAGTNNSFVDSFSGVIEGSGPLTKVGTDTLILGGINTYTGATTVNGGTLEVDGSTAAGSNVGVGTAGTLAGAGTVNGNVTLTGNGIINLTNPGTLAGTLAVTGGNWDGAGSVTGAVTSSSGTFTIGNGANLTANGGLNVTGGSIAAGNAASTITGNVNYTSNISSIFNGVIAGANKTLTMNSAGTTLTLGGANTYTGPTTVAAGTLIVTGSTAAGSATTIGNNTAVATLAGIGTLNGSVALVTTGGNVAHLAPGATPNTAGTLHVGSLNIGSGSALDIDLSANSAPGGTNDLIALGGGTLTFGGQTIVDLNALSALTAGSTYTLINGAGSIAGFNANNFTVNGLANNLEATFSDTATSLLVTFNTVPINAYYYTGAATAGAFNTAGNYQSRPSGGTTETVDLGAATGNIDVYIGATTPAPPANPSLALSQAASINSLNFTQSGAGGSVTGAFTLTIGTGGVVVQSGVVGTETISAPVALSANQTWTVADAGSTLLDSGGISGGFGLTKIGAGMLILAGTNTYTGPTAVMAGTLQVNGSTATSSAVTLAAETTLSGTGTVGGTTTVTGGTIAGSNLTLNGLVTFNGGTNTLSGSETATNGVALTGTAQVAQTGTLTGSVTDTSSGASTFAGTIAGAGSTVTLNNAAGTLTLSGANSYGGGTTLTSGNLNVTGAGTLGSATSALNVGGGTLDLGGTTQTVGAVAFTGASTLQNGTLAGTSYNSSEASGIVTVNTVLAGNGSSLTQTGGGSLFLNRANTYGGGTTISNGTLLVGNSNALGTGLITQSGGNLMTSGNGGMTINAPGGFTQTAGTLTIQLNAAPVGGLNAANDLLAVTGGATLNGNLAVKFNFVPVKGDLFTVITTTTGITGGTGPGYVTPISSPAGYQTTGSIINAGDDFQLDVTSVQFALAAQLGGSATPNQTSILNYIDNNVVSGPLFTVLTAAIGGGNLAATSADIADQFDPVKFANMARTAVFNNAVFSTQLHDNYIASGITTNGDFSASNGQIDSSGLTVVDPSMDSSLAGISSQLLAWSPAPLAHGMLSDSTPPVLGGVDMRDSKDMRAVGPTTGDNFNVYVAGNVVLAQTFSQPDLAHSDQTTGGVQMGADYRITPHLRAGAMFSYNHTDASLDNNGSKATLDSYEPGVYVAYAQDGWYANALGVYGFDNFTDDRQIALGGFSAVAHGAPSGDQITGNLDGGYDFHMKALTYGPILGLQYTHLDVDAYTEDGANALAADESVSKQQADSLRSRLGAHASYDFHTGRIVLTPHILAAWQHEFMDQAEGLNATIISPATAGAAPFTVRTPDPSRDSVLLDCGLNAQLCGQVSVFGDYLVQAGQSNYFGQSVQAGVKIGF
jgi:fibronectin-binding autotransporter adhesin